MNFQPSQEQDMLVDAVRSFVAKELLPHEEAVDRADEVSPELAAQIRDKAIAAGFYAFNMPEEVGGGGLDYLSQALIERELSKVSWALHVFVEGVQTGHELAARDHGQGAAEPKGAVVSVVSWLVLR